MVPEKELTRVPEAKHAHKMIQLKGTVVKINSPRVLKSAAPFLCGACKHTIVVPADPEQYDVCPVPTKCDSCDERGQISPMTEDQDSVYMSKDVQEIKVQEKLSNLSMGAIPRSIWVILEEDLIDNCKPGDDIVVVGVVIRRWQTLGK